MVQGLVNPAYKPQWKPSLFCFGEKDNYSHEYEICIYLHHIGDTQNQIQHDEIYMSKLKVRTD